MSAIVGARNFARYLVAYAEYYDPQEVVDEITNIMIGMDAEWKDTYYNDIVEVSQSRPVSKVCGHLLYIASLTSGASIEFDTYHLQVTICDGWGFDKESSRLYDIPGVVWDAIENFCVKYAGDDTEQEIKAGVFQTEDGEPTENLVIWSKEVYFACECPGCGEDFSNNLMIEGNESDKRINMMAGQDLRDAGWVRHDDDFWCPECARNGFSTREAE